MSLMTISLHLTYQLFLFSVCEPCPIDARSSSSPPNKDKEEYNPHEEYNSEEEHKAIETDGSDAELAEDDVIDDLRSRIANRLDGLPTKDDIDQRLQNALDQIPSADYVNGKVDELVDQ